MKDAIRDAVLRNSMVREVQEIARDRGEEAYLVGGALRDFGIGRIPKDLDFAAHKPSEFAEATARRFGRRVIPMGSSEPFTYRITAGDRILDWASLAGGTLQSDLSRRDFTVNAMAFGLAAETLIDFHGGLEDLRSGVIRMTSPEVFGEDPIRVLKAFRLLAHLEGFSLDGATEKALIRARGDLVLVAPERVQREFEDLLVSSRPGALIRRMDQAGILGVIFPELESLRGLAQNAYHHADAWEHTLEVLEALDGPPDWMSELGLEPFQAREWVTVRLAALFHDAGKAATKSVDGDGRIHFYGHPKISAEMARAILSRLRFSRELTESVAELCLNHLRPLGLIKTLPGRTALRRLIHSMGDLLPLLLALSIADKSATRGEDCEENLASLRALCSGILELRRSEGEGLRNLPKLVDGMEALEVLGLPRPGPDLGRALDALMERQVEGTIATRDEALEFLRGWKRARARKD